MTDQSTQRSRRFPQAMPVFVLVCVGALGAAQSPAPAPVGLSLNDAVQSAIHTDYRVAAAAIDTESARAQQSAASLRRLPAITLSGSYTRLSHVDQSISFGPMSVDLGSQDDAFSFAANLQYPIFAGFRLAESVNLAALQTRAKELTEAMTANAVAFETARAYWEAVRAQLNAATLRENLELTLKNYDMTAQKVAQGTALNADLLGAGMRRDQAKMDLADGLAVRDRALFYLSSLVNPETASYFGAAVNPTGDPAESTLPEKIALILSSDDASPSDAELVALALANRGETRMAGLSGSLAESAKKLAEAPLFPSLTLTGNYTFANPNQRYSLSGDGFNGTWAVGVAVSYDLGGLPANVKTVESKGLDARKASADGDRTAETVVLDVRSCRLSLERARGDLSLVTAMLDQAKENERVVAQRVKNGTAGDLDLLSASFARVRSEFAIANKQIDCRIAEADLARAAGLPVGATE